MHCPFCEEPKPLPLKFPGLELEHNIGRYNGHEFKLTTSERAILEIVSIKYPNVCLYDTIILWMYQERDEPEDALGLVKVYVTRLRRLEAFGIYLRSHHKIGYSLAASVDPCAKVGDKRRKGVVPVSAEIVNLPAVIGPQPGDLWTVIETARLFALVELGLEWVEIGERLRRSSHACRGRFRRFSGKKIAPEEIWKWGLIE
jgi:hypothetical protein